MFLMTTLRQNLWCHRQRGIRLMYAHNAPCAGHHSTRNTYETLKQSAYGAVIQQNVAEYIRSCQVAVNSKQQTLTTKPHYNTLHFGFAITVMPLLSPFHHIWAYNTIQICVSPHFIVCKPHCPRRRCEHLVKRHYR